MAFLRNAGVLMITSYAMAAEPNLRSGKTAADVHAQDGCSTGLVYFLSRQAPGCLDPCRPLICPAIGGAIGAYLRSRRIEAVEDAVCKNQGPFECLLESDSFSLCAPIFERAKNIGIVLPSSTASLRSQCAARTVVDAKVSSLISTSPVSQQASVAADVQSQDGCSSGLVSFLAHRAPGCLDPCRPTICAAVGSAIGAYLRTHRVEAVKDAVCENQGPFECLLNSDSLPLCEKIFEQARKFGVPFPESSATLRSECAGRR